MRVVRRSLPGDHKGAPLLWTILPSRFVGIVGAHPCGRPAEVLLHLSSPDQPMEYYLESMGASPAPTIHECAFQATE